MARRARDPADGYFKDIAPSDIGAAATSHTHAQADITGLVAALAALQPLDSDLTALAALTTATFGRSLLEATSATAARTLLALGTSAVADKDTDGTLAANSDAVVPSQKAVKTYADTKQAALGFTAENAANKDTDGTLAANSDTKYASQKATKTYVDNGDGLLIPKSLVDAKGDLLVGTADNTVARKAVGANDKLLVADSAQSDGMKWGDLPQSVIDTIMDWRIEINRPGTGVTASAGTWADGANASEFGYYRRINSTAANGDYQAWDQSIAAGTWAIDIVGTTWASAPIITPSIGGVSNGNLDFYTAGTVFNVTKTITGIVVPTTGKLQVKMLVNGRNASNVTAYQMVVNWIVLRRTA